MKRVNKEYAVAIMGEKQDLVNHAISIKQTIRVYNIKAISVLEALGAGVEKYREENKERNISCWGVIPKTVDNTYEVTSEKEQINE